MTYVTRSRTPAHKRRFFAVSLCLAVAFAAGCTTVPITNDVPDCDRFIPPLMRARVPGIDLPTPAQHADGHQDALPWQEGFLGQTGQLEKANDRGDAIEHIHKTCLDLHREALRKSKRGFLGRLFS